MKRIFSPIILVFVFFSSPSSYGQNEINNFIDDLMLLAENFATPAAEGAAYQASGGWFSSAQSLEKWQLDFSAKINVLFVPGNKKSSNISNADFKIINIKSSETAEIPTAYGGTSSVVFEGEVLNESFNFDAIEGINKKIIAHPFLQVSAGLPYGTEVTGRFLPKASIDGVEFSTYGLGLKHNFNQYFRNSYPTDFQFAAMVSYSKFDVKYAYKPIVINYTLFGQSGTLAKLDEIDVDANLWLFEFISSKTINSNWELFAAIGATNSNFEYVLGSEGDYLDQINTQLKQLDDNMMEIKADFGFNYKHRNFMLSSMLSAGKFFNYNLGLHYRL